MVKLTQYQGGVVEITKPRIDPALTLDAAMVESSVLLTKGFMCELRQYSMGEDKVQTWTYFLSEDQSGV